MSATIPNQAASVHAPTLIGFLLLAMVFVAGTVCLVLVWPTERQARSLLISFVGLTNDASGKRLAQFRVANHFSRRVSFGVCEVQLYDTNGWPGWVRDAGAGAWLGVAAGREQAFSVPAPLLDGAKWRVPLMYQEDLSFVDTVRFRIDLLVWGIARWRPGKPAPTRNGDSFHRTLIAYGPEMKPCGTEGSNVDRAPFLSGELPSKVRGPVREGARKQQSPTSP